MLCIPLSMARTPRERQNDSHTVPMGVPNHNSEQVTNRQCHGRSQRHRSIFQATMR